MKQRGERVDSDLLVKRLYIFSEGILASGHEDKKFCMKLSKRNLLKFAILMQAGRSNKVLSYLKGECSIRELRFWKTQEKRLAKIDVLTDKEINKAFRFRSAKKFGKWLRGLDGIGRKKSAMLLNILYRDLGYKFADPESIDIAPDIHIRRLFNRLDLADGTPKSTIEAARRLSPNYPGFLDLPSIYLSSKVCLKRNPKCYRCILSNLCPSSKDVNGNTTCV